MKRISLLVALLAVSGCASITTGQHQVVSIDTPNCPNASCTLTNKDGTYYVSSTPGTVSVNRACAKLTVSCSVEGEPDSIITVSSSIKAMAFGNIIFGGLIGAGVDTATGAACQYPSLIPVPMICGDAEEAEAGEVVAVPQDVLDMAGELECTDLVYAGTAVDGSTVYTGKCEGADSLLTCNDDGCSTSEIEIGESSDTS